MRVPWSVLVALFFAIGLPLAVFGKIADDVRENDVFRYDDVILNAVHLRATPAWDAFFVGVAHWGGAHGLLPLAALIWGALLILKRRGDFWFWGIGVGGALALNLGAKMFFRRARPDLWLSPTPQNDFSFPSGHAMLSTAFFCALIILLWPTKARWPVLFFGVGATALICLSRLYLGVHFPTDVLGGVCASLVWVNGVNLARRSTRGWRKRTVVSE